MAIARLSDEYIVDYQTKRALVIDDYPGMRSALKMALASFGVTKVDVGASAAEAIQRLRNSRYEIVVCDYNLGDSRDGQQLLEELRHRNLIGLETAFVMVTAESMYEQVVAAAELAPDDYVIKPFNGEILRNRLDAILLRKQAFREIYRHFKRGELEKSAAGCDQLIKEKPRYVVNAMRFKGELLTAMGQYEEAEALYTQVIGMRAVPWARLGLARALHAQEQNEAAEDLLADIVSESPELVAAYDLLAEVQMAQNKPHDAQKTLEQGVAISVKTVRRQKHLGEIAYNNGDLDVAREAFAQTLEKGRHSIFLAPKDYANLCRVQIEQGNAAAALETIKSGRTFLNENNDGQLVSAAIEAVAHTSTGNPTLARAALDRAASLRAAGAHADEQSMLDLAQSYLSNGRQQEADDLIGELARNAHDNDSLLAKAREIYRLAGREEVCKSILGQATATVRRLNNDALLLGQKGQLEAASDKLLEAVREAPHNPRIALNAIWMALRYTEHAGLDRERMEKVHLLFAQLEKQVPTHPRLPGLKTKLREIEARYGIHHR